jgi:hypothetical protein
LKGEEKDKDNTALDAMRDIFIQRMDGKDEVFQIAILSSLIIMEGTSQKQDFWKGNHLYSRMALIPFYNMVTRSARSCRLNWRDNFLKLQDSIQPT